MAEEESSHPRPLRSVDGKWELDTNQNNSSRIVGWRSKVDLQNDGTLQMTSSFAIKRRFLSCIPRRRVHRVSFQKDSGGQWCAAGLLALPLDGSCSSDKTFTSVSIAADGGMCISTSVVGKRSRKHQEVHLVKCGGSESRL